MNKKIKKTNYGYNNLQNRQLKRTPPPTVQKRNRGLETCKLSFGRFRGWMALAGWCGGLLPTVFRRDRVFFSSIGAPRLETNPRIVQGASRQ